MMVEIIFVIITLAFVCLFLVPKKLQYIVVFFAMSVIMFYTSKIAINAFNSPNQIQYKFISLLDNDIYLIIDNLSVFFILIINLTVFTGLLYAKGYLKHYQSEKTKNELAWHYLNFILLYISMIMVVILRDGVSFLFFWELMSVSTYFLIVFEQDKIENKEAGIKFIIQMHVALFFLIAAFLISGYYTDKAIGFDSLEGYFSTYPVFPVFILFFIGFGIKAGFMPFHTWLPHAHPSAPSHISGIMSGIMIKMGIYGILRVITYLQTDFVKIGLFIFFVSAFSGILGVIIAIVQHDYKRLLAYHSIENIGIIGIGIGAGLLGIGINNPVLASLGFAGGLLHVLNHSLFKSLLFYSSGSIYQQTHTKNIENLGGLMKKMPFTAIAFLIGSIAISGLPPLNGFISEFMIYLGFFKSLQGNNLMFSIVLLGGIVVLVIIGGLAVYCFTKVFGIIFLGNSRSEFTKNAIEVSGIMLIPKYIIIALIFLIGFFPFIILKPLSSIVAIYVGDTSVIAGISGTMKGISLTMLALIFVIAVLLIIKSILQKKRVELIESTWGCGYTGANPALHQYTATSYASYIAEKAKFISGLKTEYKPLSKDEIFPNPAKFKSKNSDIFENIFVLKPTKYILNIFEKVAVFQTGNIQHYLLYAIVYVIVMAILSILKFI